MKDSNCLHKNSLQMNMNNKVKIGRMLLENSSSNFYDQVENSYILNQSINDYQFHSKLNSDFCQSLSVESKVKDKDLQDELEIERWNPESSLDNQKYVIYESPKDDNNIQQKNPEFPNFLRPLSDQDKNKICSRVQQRKVAKTLFTNYEINQNNKFNSQIEKQINNAKIHLNNYGNKSALQKKQINLNLCTENGMTSTEDPYLSDSQQQKTKELSIKTCQNQNKIEEVDFFSDKTIQNKQISNFNNTLKNQILQNYPQVRNIFTGQNNRNQNTFLNTQPKTNIDKMSFQNYQIFEDLSQTNKINQNIPFDALLQGQQSIVLQKYKEQECLAKKQMIKMEFNETIKGLQDSQIYKQQFKNYRKMEEMKKAELMVVEQQNKNYLKQLEDIKKKEDEEKIRKQQYLKILFQKLDQFMAEYNEERNPQYIIRLIQLYKNNPKLLNEELVNNIKLINQQLEQHIVAEAQLHKKYMKNNNFRYVKNTALLLQMGQELQDKEFKKQFENAHEDSKEFLNNLLKDFGQQLNQKKDEDEQKLILKLLYDKFYGSLHSYSYQIQKADNKGQILKIGNTTYGAKATQLLLKLKSAFIQYTEMQFKINSKNRNIKNSPVRPKTLCIYNESVQNMQIINLKYKKQQSILMCKRHTSRYKKASKKFRQIVANHFLSFSLKKLQNMDFSKINYLQIIQLTKFKNVMIELYPSDSCKDLGRKYLQIGRNQFKNDYLRDVVNQQPVFNDYFKVFYSLEGELQEVIKQKIITEQEDYRCKDDFDWDKVFKIQTDNQLFYHIMKKQKISKKEEKNSKKDGILKYFELSGMNFVNKAVSTALLQYYEKTLFMFERKITEQESIGLQNYLRVGAKNSEMQIRTLIVDSCQMDDNILANILQGLLNQVLMWTDINKLGQQITYKRQSFHNFIYSNNNFGFKSLELLNNFEEFLIEIKLNNINQKLNVNYSLTQKITEQFSISSKFLMKLSLSNINLNDEGTITNLCNILKYKEHLQYLDLSNTQLQPQYMNKLSLVLKDLYRTLRDLNLSYNQLKFKIQDSQDFKFSESFIQNICQLILKSVILNHLNFSGMDITKASMIYLCTEIQNAKLLLSIHLNDNGISSDYEYMYEILDIFGIIPDDIPFIKRDEEDPNCKIQKTQNTFELKNIQKYEVLNQSLQHYMRQKSPEVKLQNNENQQQNENNFFDKEINQKRNQFKDYVLLAKQLENYEKQKQINISKHFIGLGRNDIGLYDFFTLTRILNHPELIFNQRPNQDSDKNNRYFQIDSAAFWQLSVKSECIVCQKHMYVQIHYQRGILSQNKELIEIKDQKILDELKYQYNKDFLSHRNTTPLICGTIVQKHYGQGTFERQLKMLRTPLYCLLSICSCQSFSETKQQVFKTKDGVKKFLKTDAYELLQEMKIDNKLMGWQFILNDMILNNEVYDLYSINTPDLSAYNLEKQDWFTFAGFLQPGYHQFLIYDPKLERAFCKDFITKLNQKDFVYPEYPIAYDAGPQKVTPNMWKHWIEDDENSLLKSFKIDVQSEKFRIDKFMKNKEDQENCINFLREKYSEVMIYQKILIVGSTQLPQINFENISYCITNLQEQEDYPQLTPSGKLSRAQVELCFIGATFLDGIAGLKGALQRAELIDFFMRLCQQFTKQVYTYKSLVSDHLQEFWDIYVIPLIKKNEIIEHRRIIRKSKKLNQLLYDNNKGLIEIFEQAKLLDENGKNGFSLKAATLYFTSINKPGEIYLSRRMIETIYMYSMMTVIDEFKHEKKYYYLLFVEFQEMICRAAIVGFDDQMQDTIEFKVYNLLDYIWEFQCQKGYWKIEEKPLIKVNQELFF